MVGPRLRAPRQHRGLLAVPNWSSLDSIVSAHRRFRSDATVPPFGLSLAEVHSQALAELATGAAPKGLAVTGHQPELYHPGVWVKSVAIHHLARRFGLTPLHFLVDNDTLKSVALQVPHRDQRDGRLQIVQVPFDAVPAIGPWEEREVADEALFRTFPERVEAATAGLGLRPILPEFWQGATALAARTKNLGTRLAGARHVWESRWGCQNLEFPLSRLCQTGAFALFAGQLLADVDQFRQLHNELLTTYRQEHGLRSKQHPVPDLDKDGDLTEAPFWVWRKGSKQRSRLYVGRDHAGLILTNRQDIRVRLPSPAAVAAERWQQEWQALAELGIKIRTRALTTTLFTRTYLADLFVHGIGGALYDQITDGLIRRLYGKEAPGFLTLSATLFLKHELARMDALPVRQAKRWLRDVTYQPDRFVVDDDDEFNEAGVSALIFRKQALVQQRPMTRTTRRNRFRDIRAANEALHPYVASKLTAAQHSLEQARASLEQGAFWSNREFAGVLHQAEELDALMLKVTDAARG